MMKILYAPRTRQGVPVIFSAGGCLARGGGWPGQAGGGVELQTFLRRPRIQILVVSKSFFPFFFQARECFHVLRHAGPPEAFRLEKGMFVDVDDAPGRGLQKNVFLYACTPC